MSPRMPRTVRFGLSLVAAVLLALPVGAGAAGPGEQARSILKTAAVPGGLIVHVGCGDGKLTAALRADDRYVVHALDTSAANVAAARKHIQSLGLYGKVSVAVFDGVRLPYTDNLVNLLVAEDFGRVPAAEAMRVLAPGGVLCTKSGGSWTRRVKPRPDTIDEWTHYLHGPGNNAVAKDTVVGPPRRMQWVGGPRYGRHHDRMSSLSAAVTAGGRVFYIFDESPPFSILSPPKWTLVARDAFNGTVLWKRPLGHWFTHLWPLKSGPAQLPRRLVAGGDRVYVTLALDAPLTALDAATGKTVWTCEKTRATEEVILSDGVLVARVNDAADKDDYDGRQRARRGYAAKMWDEAPRKIFALSADTGQVLWTRPRRVLPVTLAADAKHVVFHDGQSVVCLNRADGKEAWRSEPVERAKEIRGFYAPILVLYQDVVLFSGGETAGMQTGSWYTSGKDTMTALSAETGKVLWTAYHPPSGYRSPEDLLVADGLVWTGETTSGRAEGLFTGRDPHTGKVVREFKPDVHVYWFHHRCYRGKATEKYLLMARAGTEFLDVRKQTWSVNHWVRGACLYGVMPANGLLYAPQHPCACYLETKLSGFNALAPAGTGPRVPPDAAKAPRLAKGPAYADRPNPQPASPAGRSAIPNPQSAISNPQSAIPNPQSEDWPTYRHDAARSGRASTTIPAALKPAWQVQIGGKLTSPVVADGKAFVASIDDHTVHAVDTASGKEAWRFQAGGRVDSPPTIYQGRVLFGSADGFVYCLRAADGELAWRFRAAPMDQRTMSYGQIESVWPVHGSVLVQGGVAYFVAGRSMFLDGGLSLWRLDPLTGRVLSQTVMNDTEAKTGKELHDYVSWLNMPVGLPDVLSTDGKLVYMRSQPFGLDGTRLPLKPFPRGADADAGAPQPVQAVEHTHLFSPTGFLDDTWWHRTYWMYGSMFVSGWCGYYRAGTTAPAGRILVFDDAKVYGFGRKPKYYRWTTPIEHHLFAADRPGAAAPAEASVPSAPARKPVKESRVRVPKSKSLDPSGKPLTVAAWVQADKPAGVILAHGGGGLGYVLYLKAGRGQFSVRSGGKLSTVAAKGRAVGTWTHLAGVLTAAGELRIYVNGKPAGTAKSHGLVTGDPQEAMQIGADENSCVGEYAGPAPFAGLIDEVRVYHRALAAGEIAQLAAASPAKTDAAGLVLALSFDQGKAADASGSKNDGTVDGAKAAKGKVGGALKFSGGGAARPATGFKVALRWTSDLPLFARALLLSGQTLFIAGPADVVDEEQAFRKIDDPQVQAALAEQVDVMAGKKGAVLWAVSAADGAKRSELTLKSMPVFAGLAAARGKLYMSTTDGKLICLEKK